MRLMPSTLLPPPRRHLQFLSTLGHSWTGKLTQGGNSAFQNHSITTQLSRFFRTCYGCRSLLDPLLDFLLRVSLHSLHSLKRHKVFQTDAFCFFKKEMHSTTHVHRHDRKGLKKVVSLALFFPPAAVLPTLSLAFALLIHNKP
jgi:hypothetical protein